jgi:rubrerythrin
MKIIKQLSEMIEDELEGAEEYIECALKHKDDNPTLAKVFYDISMQEMTHVDMLHGEVVKLIQQHQKEQGDPPPAMMAVYEYMHERQIKWANKIKTYQMQFRG